MEKLFKNFWTVHCSIEYMEAFYNEFCALINQKSVGGSPSFFYDKLKNVMSVVDMTA